MALEEDVIKVLEQTASNLQRQSELLRKQATDLRKDAVRIRAVSKNNREGRKKKK